MNPNQTRTEATGSRWGAAAASLRRGLNTNWHLAALCVLLMGAGAFGFLTSNGGEAGVSQAEPNADRGEAREGSDPSIDSAGTSTRRPMELTKNDKFRIQIDAYKKAIEEDPHAEETKIRLKQIANLYYVNLKNYEQAMIHYERLLYDFTDWEDADEAYLPLLDCYEKLGDKRGLARVADYMMKHFPKESTEYIVAKEKVIL